MTGDDLDARNTFEHPDNVVPQEVSVTGITEKKGNYAILIPKLSWNVLRFSGVDNCRKFNAARIKQPPV